MVAGLPQRARETAAESIGAGDTVATELPPDARATPVPSAGDPGGGFDPQAPRSRQSFGLTSMRERTESLGGSFEILSAPGSGTQIEVTLP
jgi:two-component sensor histidine kinase